MCSFKQSHLNRIKKNSTCLEEAVLAYIDFTFGTSYARKWVGSADQKAGFDYMLDNLPERACLYICTLFSTDITVSELASLLGVKHAAITIILSNAFKKIMATDLAPWAANGYSKYGNSLEARRRQYAKMLSGEVAGADNVKLTELHLPARVFDCLNWAGYKTLADIRPILNGELHPYDLPSGFGFGGVEQLRQEVTPVGRFLRTIA